MSVGRCPSCSTGKLAVIDSRIVLDGDACRRRYRCECGARFTTMEVIVSEATAAEDVKPGGSRPYSKSKEVLGRIAAARIIGGSGEPM
jgi:transcriptional regulator NrdR family protein